MINFRHNFLRSFVLCCSLVILLGSVLFNTEAVQKQVFAYALYPFLVIENTIITPMKKKLYWWRGASELRAVAEQLAHERDELLQKNIALEATLEYLNDCQEAREFKKRYASDQAIIAQVLLKNFSPQGHYFLLGAGRSRGIQENMVAVYKNNLIGRVSEVYQWHCKVVLITDPNCRVSAKCVGTGSPGIHMGSHQLQQTHLGFVNHLAQLKVDDLVISHGKGTVFPRGFALGRIKEYQLEGVHYQVVLEPLIDLRTIEFCTIIQKRD